MTDHCEEHCRACSTGDWSGLVAEPPKVLHSDLQGVSWRFACPRCAERKRIVEAIEAEAEIWGTIARDAFNDGDPCLDAYDSDVKARTLKEAAKIARGEV